MVGPARSTSSVKYSTGTPLVARDRGMGRDLRLGQSRLAFGTRLLDQDKPGLRPCEIANAADGSLHATPARLPGMRSIADKAGEAGGGAQHAAYLRPANCAT